MLRRWLRMPFRGVERRARRFTWLRRPVRTLAAASRVREPLRFTWRELRGREGAHPYRLRDSGQTVILRQPLLDMFVLEEVFRHRAYAFPEQVRGELGSLGRPPRVLDLGGHVGMFGLFCFGELGEAEVTSYEPDPGSFTLLERCRGANGLDDRWRLVLAFASNGAGMTEFLAANMLGRAADGEAELDATRERVEEAFPFMRKRRFAPASRFSVPAHDVLPELAEADLAKIDIEGGEWALLTDPRFAESAPRHLVIEYHRSGAPSDDFRSAARAALTAAGYRLGGEAELAEDAGMLWATREPCPEGTGADEALTSA